MAFMEQVPFEEGPEHFIHDIHSAAGEQSSSERREESFRIVPASVSKYVTSLAIFGHGAAERTIETEDGMFYDM